MAQEKRLEAIEDVLSWLERVQQRRQKTEIASPTVQTSSLPSTESTWQSLSTGVSILLAVAYGLLVQSPESSGLWLLVGVCLGCLLTVNVISQVVDADPKPCTSQDSREQPSQNSTSSDLSEAPDQIKAWVTEQQRKLDKAPNASQPIVVVADYSPPEENKADAEEMQPEARILKTVDDLHRQEKFDDEVELLKSGGSYRTLWRLARAYSNIGKTKQSTDDDRKVYLSNAWKTAQKALRCLEDTPETAAAHSNTLPSEAKEMAQLHKWVAITAGEMDPFVGMSDRIANSHVFQKHTRLAMKFDPADHDPHHMLGRFSYELAGLSFVVRRAAALVQPLPDATYDDALKSFEEAHRLCPSWLLNELWRAKCLAKCSATAKARQVLQAVANSKAHCHEDQQAVEDAKRELEKLSSSWF